MTAETAVPTPSLSSPSTVGSAADTPAIHTLELTKRYRSTIALAGLTMVVRRGEVYGFLGPNGAGKTTAVKLLVGLTRPTSGEAWVLGMKAGDRLTRGKVGYLPELFRYQDWLTAGEVLKLHCDLAGVVPKRKAEEIEKALVTVGLQERGGDRVGTFSKGMQQRLGLGVALLNGPELVLLDEPTSALDPVGRHDVREIIRSLKRDGVTVFLNSHLLTEVEMVCDRVAIVDKGRVISQGTLDELRSGGSSVDVRVTGLDGTAEVVLGDFGDVELVGENRYTVRGLEREAVPRLVEALVGRGGRVYAVEPSVQSLEDRFLELLGGSTDGHHNDSPPDPA